MKTKYDNNRTNAKDINIKERVQNLCKEKGIFLIPIAANKVAKNDKLDTELIVERLGKFLREIDEYERTSEEWRKLEYY